MKRLEDYVRVLSFVLSSAAGSIGCAGSTVNQPKTEAILTEPIPYPAVNCYAFSEKDAVYTVCEYDFDGDGKIERVEKEIRNRNNNCLKRLTDYGADGIYEKEEHFVYDSEGSPTEDSLIKHIVKEGNKTSIYEYAEGKAKKDFHDYDSDGNVETIFIYNENGTITYLGDENDDGLPEVRSEEVTADYAGSFDPDGNEGIAYQRILNISRDLDLNGRFDRTEFLFHKPAGINRYCGSAELILYDKNEDGSTEEIRKKRYDSQGNLVLEKFDSDGDKKWDFVWTPDTGWTNLN